MFLLWQKQQNTVQHMEISRSLFHEGMGKFRQAGDSTSIRGLGEQGYTIPEFYNVIIVNSGYAVILLFRWSGRYAGILLNDICHDTDKLAVLRINFHPICFFLVRGGMNV